MSGALNGKFILEKPAEPIFSSSRSEKKVSIKESEGRKLYRMCDVVFGNDVPGEIKVGKDFDRNLKNRSPHV